MRRQCRPGSGAAGARQRHRPLARATQGRRAPCYTGRRAPGAENAAAALRLRALRSRFCCRRPCGLKPPGVAPAGRAKARARRAEVGQGGPRRRPRRQRVLGDIGHLGLAAWLCAALRRFTLWRPPVISDAHRAYFNPSPPPERGGGRQADRPNGPDPPSRHPPRGILQPIRPRWTCSALRAQAL